MLIIMAGLPASGKTAIARALARRITAVHLRIDTIEQAVVRAGLAEHPVGPVGYTVAYALAGDQLRLGLTVVADSVNPLAITRQAWRDVARTAGTGYLEVEVVCSDAVEHERRATARDSDIEGHTPPSWQSIVSHDYEPWDRDRVVIDTATTTVDEAVSQITAMVAASADR